jgi:hypothetical protein
MIKEEIGKVFPRLSGHVFYESNFEKTLNMIPKDEELVVIASDTYHDEGDFLFKDYEKDGDKLALEIKKVNPRARVYIFSTYKPKPGNIDGYFPKSRMGDNTISEIVDIFAKLGLDKL